MTRVRAEYRQSPLLEARIAPEYRGSGLSALLLQAAIGNARRLGIGHLFGPVRPTGKPSEPRTPMTEYVRRTRSDGLPADPWLRTHARIGGRIVRLCPLSMTIAGTLDDWREWTGLPLTTSGLLDVPGALVPVHVSVEQDHAAYVEPNVWVHHRVRPAARAQQVWPIARCSLTGACKVLKSLTLAGCHPTM